MTAGGDDVEFLWLILYCVLQFFKTNPCQEQIARSQGIIDSELFYNSLDYVIKNALIRGITAAGPGFKLFVTSYAQFFNATTSQCDDACFSYWDPDCTNSVKLTQPLRQQFNTLAVNLNNKIQQVVENNAAWDVEYVSYDDQFQGHRFCEQGNTEPDNNNPNIWFFHLNTEGNGRTQAIDDKFAAMLSGSNNAQDFYNAIKSRSATAWGTDLDPNQNATGAYDTLFNVGDNSDVGIQNALSGYIRIFHPTLPGINTIEDQIFSAFPNWPPADPPPGAAAVSSAAPVPSPSSTPAPTPPPYAKGTCSFHVDEYQNCLDDSKNLFANITIFDNDKNVIGQTPLNAVPGVPINAATPYSMDSKLADPLVVVGEHEGDYIQFTLGNQQWTSRTTTAPYFASNGGWNPRDGPECTRFGIVIAVSLYFLSCIYTGRITRSAFESCSATYTSFTKTDQCCFTGKSSGLFIPMLVATRGRLL